MPLDVSAIPPSLAPNEGTLQVVTTGRKVNQEEGRKKSWFRLTLSTWMKTSGGLMPAGLLPAYINPEYFGKRFSGVI